MPFTNKQKQQALRKRRSEAGLKEMRGIYVTDQEEKKLKPQIKKDLEKMRKK